MKNFDMNFSLVNNPYFATTYFAIIKINQEKHFLYLFINDLNSERKQS